MVKMNIFCILLLLLADLILSSSFQEEQIDFSDNSLILHREKRSIFGFLSFLVVLLNAALAINLNMNINNNG